jgi:hypothetical protein
MSKKIDRLIIAARKAAEESSAAHTEWLDARSAECRAKSRMLVAEDAARRANGELLEAVRES